MAGPASTIESHPQRQKIIDALLAGSTLRQIAAWTEPKVTESAICRWRRNVTLRTNTALDSAKAAIALQDKGLQHVAPNGQDLAMQSVARAALTLAVDPFVARGLAQDRRRASWMDDLEQAPEAADYRTLAALDRNDLAAQEYHARLAGRLDSAATITNIQIVLPAQSGASTPTDAWDGQVIDIKPQR